MPGKISFGPTACALFVDAQERKKANEKDFTISFKLDENEYQLMEKFTNHWLGIPKIPDIAFPKFGPEKTFTAWWSPTTIHPSTDMMHQHTLNHLKNQLQVAADKAYKAFASEPKVTFATVAVGFLAVDKYCSAALSAVRAAEYVVMAPARSNFYQDELLQKTAFKSEPYFNNQHKLEIFKIADGAKQKLYTTNVNGMEVTTYGEPFKAETRYDTFHKPKAKNIDDYLAAKSPLGRTNKQHKLIMDMNKKGKRR